MGLFLLAAGAGAAGAEWAPEDPWEPALAPLKNEGIQLQERVEVQGAQGESYLLAILQQEAGRKRPEAHLLRLYRLEADRLSLLDEVNFGESGIRFNHRYNLRPLLGGDSPCVVLQWSAGRDCGVCRQLRLFQLQGERLAALELDLPPIDWQDPFPKGIAPQRLEDVDGDGIYELLSEDTRWEYYDELFAREDSPKVWVISRWHQGKYRESSAAFPSFYEAQIQQLRSRLPARENTPFGRSYQGQFTFEELYLKVAFSIFLNYVQKGAKEEGWKQFQEMIQRENLTIWKSHAQRLLQEIKKKYSL